MTTIATSVPVVDGPLPDAAALDARLAELRRRFPRAIIDRYLATLPTVGERALIFPGAAVVGDVRLGDDVSVWYGCVLRGDLRAGDRGRAARTSRTAPSSTSPTTAPATSAPTASSATGR